MFFHPIQPQNPLFTVRVVVCAYLTLQLARLFSVLRLQSLGELVVQTAARLPPARLLVLGLEGATVVSCCFRTSSVFLEVFEINAWFYERCSRSLQFEPPFVY